MGSWEIGMRILAEFYRLIASGNFAPSIDRFNEMLDLGTTLGP